MGLSWARLTLGGMEKPDPNAPLDWSATITYSSGSKVVHKGRIWQSTGYMAVGVEPGTPDLPNWAKWNDIGEVTPPGFTKKNPDNTPIQMTFNMISGLYVPAWGNGWQDRESEYGFYTDQIANPYVAEKSGHKRIAISWGREAKYGTVDIPDRDGTDYMVQGVKKLIEAGHEIGNHTIDHLETNSPFPRDQWPNSGDGFDDGTSGKDAQGNPWSEVEEFGGHEQGYQQTCGWKYGVGYALEKQTWKEIIALGEVDGPKQGITEELVAFRAPRLEVNSAMFYALQEQGYLYDCGLEEGYESFRDGTNFVWPYTTDNGTPDCYTKLMNFEPMPIDSMPAGFWQYPVNAMIVPENMRADVFAQAQIIAAAEGEDHGTLEEWDGKITGFDFNMFILWSMTGPQVEATLKHTLDLRMAGNKAPMQIGCHTDYFTPIYDNATLTNETNKDVYGLALAYNEWDDRKKAFENFVDYGLEKGAYFKSGKETIAYVKELMATEKIGPNTRSVNPSEWSFIEDEEGSTGDATVSSINNTQVTLKTGMPNAGYMAEIDASNFEGLTHVELEYLSNVPLVFTLMYNDGSRRDVLLNNVNRYTESGKIPYGAFHSDADYSQLNSKEISSIAVFPRANGEADVNANFTVKNIKFYTGGETALGDVTVKSKAGIALNSTSNGTMKLSVTEAGAYDVKLYAPNGQIIRSIDGKSLTAGANAVPLGNVPAGLYIVKVNSKKQQLVTKAVFK